MAKAPSPPSAEPEELIHPLSDKPGHLMRRAMQRSSAAYSEEAREFGITGPQHVILVALAHNPGVDQNTLAELVDLDRWTTGDIVARLERAGLVVREVNPRDRRGRLLFLPPAGRRLVRDMAPAVVRTQQRFLAPLSAEEQRQFLHLLRKLVGLEPPA
ncbi:MarR family winged helix-turn-helix transcriptional regulator [Roseomonas sp. BN140053]|uniref:MarR family winged helix-turn-helix transcriptional regulator n=1 Tax=Roseomonas sp. BN140053 TaxID=3391898 RepID=UPI0039EC48A6